MKTIVKKFGITKNNDVNLLLHRDGTATACVGITHIEACQSAKTTLYGYLNSGGCRVKVYRDELVIESRQKLSDNQKTRLRMVVKKGQFTCVVVVISNKWYKRCDFNRVKMNQLADILT